MKVGDPLAFDLELEHDIEEGENLLFDGNLSPTYSDKEARKAGYGSKQTLDRLK